MSNMRVKQHPTLGILVGTDGHVMVPATSNSKAHWTLGSKHSEGYKTVQINGKPYFVHRLIAETFLGEIPKGCEIDHKSRVRDDNRLENIRIVTSHDNHINTSAHDRVEARGGTHWYEDEKQYYRECSARYRAEHPEKGRRYRAKNREELREYQSRYRQAKCKTHRRVHFADGSKHWLPLAEAKALLAIPLKERIFNEKHFSGSK